MSTYKAALRIASHFPAVVSARLSALRRPARMAVLGAICGGLMLGACNTDKLLEAAAPETGFDPATFKTSAGAQLLYNNAVADFNIQFWGGSRPTVLYTAMFSDEMAGNSSFHNFASARREEEPLGNTGHNTASFQYYQRLQRVRLGIEAAIPPMQRYAPLAPKAWVGQLFALGGYTALWLGEHFCAGTPISTLVYEGDLIYGDPLTTEQMHLNALARFDSALMYATDSARILNLARVGKGRALLNIGRFAEAAVAVKDVPTSFAYEVQFTAPDGAGGDFSNAFFTQTGGSTATFSVGFTVADREGTNGLNYVSANDPRTRTDARGTERIPINRDRNSSVVLANGAEARLIEAEAALQANDIAGWTAKLNALRATCAASNPACPAAIPPLTADSTTTASAALRVDVMFRERAFWTFLTAHRMGDMRRLVRQYNRPQQSVFPTGDAFFRNAFVGTYGSDVNYPPDRAEYEYNPKFHGCLDRAA